MHILHVVIPALLLFSATFAMAADAVPLWHPHDLPFTTAAAPQEPFKAAFSADVTGPGGAKFSLPGFYDGDNTWKIRVSPTAEGEWTVVTHSSVSDLDRKRSTFTCSGKPLPGIHGPLKVDPQLPHQFVYEDGTRYFSSGYECDWLWALDVNDPELKTINPFLDKLVGFGFNSIILNTYAHDTSWKKGKTEAEDYGPPPIYPWEGSNEQPDFSRFNLAFWKHYDRVMDSMYRRGMWAHVFLRVYNKQVKWPANGSAEDEQYYRWMVARYAAYPNITWDVAKEAQYEKDLGYKVGRLEYFRKTDPYRRLLTVHDDRAMYDKGSYDGLADYRSDQQHKDFRNSVIAHRKQRAWPVINTEFGYEHGPKGPTDKTYNHVQSPEEVARRGWQVYMGGGFGAYYYTYTAWDVLRTQETPPGYAYFKNLRTFFEGTSYWRMEPVEGVASAGVCLAETGKEYIVFLDAAAPTKLTLPGVTKAIKGEWYNPFTGQRQDAGKVSDASEVTPPAEWGGGPVALHLVVGL
ncbi:MAG: DUF4038 domain-containing protein [Burkholderiales bacterium]|nr:DUF4038 domain-containing protein [Phycisphaerae bacterium]